MLDDGPNAYVSTSAARHKSESEGKLSTIRTSERSCHDNPLREEWGNGNFLRRGMLGLPETGGVLRPGIIAPTSHPNTSTRRERACESFALHSTGGRRIRQG